MLRVSNIKLSIDDDKSKIKSSVLKKLKIKESDLQKYFIYKESVDARKRGKIDFVYTVDVIVKNEIYDVCVVVTRYFGGVLLGTGGLVRAYSHGAKIALDAAKIVMMQNCLVCSARCTYNRYGKVSALVTDNGGAVDDTVYEGDVLIKFHIKPDLLLQLNKKLADATAGEVQAVFDEEKYYAVEL